MPRKLGLRHKPENYSMFLEIILPTYDCVKIIIILMNIKIFYLIVYLKPVVS